ncbi:uncharacterized protein LOC126750727 [Anthonomus grandis grandis]|uniref:uncharacterized protein LOC126750727 n=1 Tax=Anthonomus grandis grandis TaxID=2921223 RepID=UPI0021660E50|nr:uncharacterized protein LOC126750727 [Anthonomus grandis grandis]
METLIPEVQKEIEKIAKNHDFEKFTIDITNTASDAGDGYIGVIEAGCLKDENTDKKINLVLKKAPTSINLRKQFPVREAFTREIYIYEKLFPEFLSFQTEHNVTKIFNNFPKLYGCVEDEYKETLIMENLKESGFKLADRTKPFDANHLNLVIRTYAKLHAVSYGMKKLEPEKFKLLSERISINIMMIHRDQARNAEREETSKSEEGQKENRNMMGAALLKSCFNAIKDRPDLTSELQKCVKNIFAHTTDINKEKYAVVIHSDCWSANLLFKYEDESKPCLPTDISIIDWQTSLVSNPMHDISYFLFVTAGKEDLNNYKGYLRTYYQALCENLNDFGIEAESFYPFELLEQHWKRYSRIGFLMSSSMLRQSLSTTKTRDLSQMADNGQNVFDEEDSDDDSELYKQRMIDLVEFIIENKFLEI